MATSNHEPTRTDAPGATTTTTPATPATTTTPATPAREERLDRAAAARENAYERFGGINLGAGVFGWLVAVAVTVLLTSVIGAALAALGQTDQITLSEADRAAGTVSLAAGITLLVVLAIAYFTGGYVAGRMSRFDGAKQGLGTWLVGLIVTIVAIVVGAVAGSQYNVLDRVDLPRIPLPSDDVTLGGLVVAVALLVLTALSAMLGGKIGTRYHLRVDRAHQV